MINNSAKISVICVLYYSSHLLSKLIQNIKGIIGDQLGEIIFVNNSKRDNVTNYNDEIVKVFVPQSNLGYGGAINYGVAVAKYENLLLINPDLELIRFDLNIDENALFLIGGFNPEMPFGNSFPTLLRDTLRITFRRFFPFHFLDFIIDVPHQYIDNKAENNTVDYVSGSLLFTNKRSFQTINGFDTAFFLFYEEIDICKRAKSKGVDVFISKSITYNHTIRNSASSLDTSDLKIYSELSSFSLYHKKYHSNYYFLANLFIFLFIIIFYPIVLIINKVIIDNSYFKKRKRIMKIYCDYFIYRRKYEAN